MSYNNGKSTKPIKFISNHAADMEIMNNHILNVEKIEKEVSTNIM